MADKTYTVLHSTYAGCMLTLEQAGYDNFAVQYGMQRKESLSYTMAAKEYGECLMHGLACEGLLEIEED